MSTAPPSAGDGPGAAGPSSRRELREQRTGAAGPLLRLLIGAVSIGVALLLLWGLGQREPDTAAAPEMTASPLPSAEQLADDDEATPSATALDADELAAAIARLDELTVASSCSNLYADAQVFHEYTATAGAAGAWPDLVAARRPAVTVDSLASHCDEGYARQLARYIIDDPRAEELLVYTLQDHLAELPQHHPAPSGAAEIEAFRTSDGEVGCTLTVDGVGCAVEDHDFADPPACLDAGEAFSVALFATDVYPCAGTVDGGRTRLPEGESATVGDYACTAIEDGVRCWHTVSGTAFELTPTAVTLP